MFISIRVVVLLFNYRKVYIVVEVRLLVC
jgi:hypothetical protein